MLCKCEDAELEKVDEMIKRDYEKKKEYKIEGFKCKKCNLYRHGNVIVNDIELERL